MHLIINMVTLPQRECYTIYISLCYRVLLTFKSIYTMVKRVYSYSKKTHVLSCRCTYGTYEMVLTFNFLLQSLTAARVTVCPIQWFRNEIARFMDYASSSKKWTFSDDTLDLFDTFD